jgi:hypothetical protein
LTPIPEDDWKSGPPPSPQYPTFANKFATKIMTSPVGWGARMQAFTPCQCWAPKLVGLGRRSTIFATKRTASPLDEHAGHPER